MTVVGYSGAKCEKCSKYTMLQLEICCRLQCNTCPIVSFTHPALSTLKQLSCTLSLMFENTHLCKALNGHDHCVSVGWGQKPIIYSMLAL